MLDRNRGQVRTEVRTQEVKANSVCCCAEALMGPRTVGGRQREETNGLGGAGRSELH